MLANMKVGTKLAAMLLVPLVVLGVLAALAMSGTGTAPAVYLVVALAGAVVAVTVAYVVGRSITRPLHQLTAAADRLAGEQLPALVTQLQTGTYEAPAASGELDGTHGGELGRLAAALNGVQRVTADVAQQQGALLRKGIGDLFVNLARRNQALLDRQIEFIDQLEANETDPDQLENLFRLDHLATRMRRNAESLLVLAGAEPARRRGRPVALAEVLRVAVGEIADYARVRIRDLDEVLVSATAAVDAAHLLAELMDNATQYSPPQTTVEVSGRAAPDGGYVLSIVDQGIGLGPDQLRDSNAVLGEPPVMGLELGRSLGFVVIGRLAQRHGITVRLAGEPNGGTVASVTLPAGVAGMITAAPGSSVTGSALDLTDPAPFTEPTSAASPVTPGPGATGRLAPGPVGAVPAATGQEAPADVAGSGPAGPGIDAGPTAPAAELTEAAPTAAAAPAVAVTPHGGPDEASATGAVTPADPGLVGPAVEVPAAVATGPVAGGPVDVTDPEDDEPGLLPVSFPPLQLPPLRTHPPSGEVAAAAMAPEADPARLPSGADRPGEPDPTGVQASASASALLELGPHLHLVPDPSLDGAGPAADHPRAPDLPEGEPVPTGTSGPVGEPVPTGTPGPIGTPEPPGSLPIGEDRSTPTPLPSLFSTGSMLAAGSAVPAPPPSPAPAEPAEDLREPAAVATSPPVTAPTGTDGTVVPGGSPLPSRRPGAGLLARPVPARDNGATVGDSPDDAVRRSPREQLRELTRGTAETAPAARISAAQRSPEEVRSMLSRYRTGLQRGRGAPLDPAAVAAPPSGPSAADFALAAPPPPPDGAHGAAVAVETGAARDEAGHDDRGDTWPR